MAVLSELLEQEREQLCGPKDKHNSERGAYRHGHDEGSVVLGGRTVRVRRPLARTTGGEEQTLPMYEAVASSLPSFPE